MALLAPITDLVLFLKNPVGAEVLLEFSGISVGERFRVGIFLVEGRGDLVYPHIRGLRRENRRYQELKRIFVFKFASSFRIGFIQASKNRSSSSRIGSQNAFLFTNPAGFPRRLAAL